MDQINDYLLMFSIIIIAGQFLQSKIVPLGLVLVAIGTIMSFVPYFPSFNLDPETTLNFFLPLLIYEVSAFSSWTEIKKNLRPIALLSVGHVIFITILVAISIHLLVPELGWPLSFVLGAVVSPPDDAAIFSISKNIRFPEKIFTILKGEAMFNDAAALILFRFSLAALITHQFSILHASFSFLAIIIFETLYGLLLGHLLGKLREKLTNPALHVMASLLTPFLAYIPVVKLGGSGVIATVITGFIIGNYYSLRYTSEFRLISRGIWPALAFAIQGILFLLIGYNIKSIFEGISFIPFGQLLMIACAIVSVVILGRFVWSYVFVSFLPRLFFSTLRKKEPSPSWKFLFLVSWTGMRGSISLAAVLSVPFLPAMTTGANPRDLLIFLVSAVIVATLILQGISLPWIIKLMGAQKHGQRERYHEHLLELSARINMTKRGLKWLLNYKKQIKNNKDLLEETKVYIDQYKMTLKKLKERVLDHDVVKLKHDGKSDKSHAAYVLLHIAEAEKKELLKLWRGDKINLSTRNKLMERLDHQIQNYRSL